MTELQVTNQSPLAYFKIFLFVFQMFGKKVSSSHIELEMPGVFVFLAVLG